MVHKNRKRQKDEVHVPDYMNLCPACGLLYYHDEVVEYKGKVLCMGCYKALRATERASRVINRVCKN